jgi:hypothetical protein
MQRPKRPDDTVEVTCPKCGEIIRVSEKQAEAHMTVRCSKGHEIPLVKAL